MMAWEASSVTSLYTTEPSVVSLPPAPVSKKVTVKGAFLAVLATQKTPFKRHFQQPDDGCLPPVMPKRKVAVAARKVSNVRPPAQSETTTDNPPPLRPTGQQTRPATADKPHPIPVTPLTSVESRRCSQPRVDQYRSLMTVQSAFSPLPTPYYDTNATTQKQQWEPDPASTPRLSNTRKGKNKTATNLRLSMSHSESSTETPKLDNTSRRFLTAPVNYHDNQLVFIGGY